MMAAAIAGAAVSGILSPTWVKAIIRHDGNVVHRQLCGSAGKPVNRLARSPGAREIAQDAVPLLQGNKQVQARLTSRCKLEPPRKG